MKTKLISLIIFMSLLFTACTSSGTQPTEPTALPPVLADANIAAEGRVEPIYFAEIAFSTSGVISEVLVQEGEAVTKGQPLIRLGDAFDTNYAAAQLELVSAQQAINDLTNAAGTDLAQAIIDLKDAQETYDKAAHYLTYLQNAQRVPQTENRTFLIQTHRGWEYRTNTRNFKGPAPEDWITEAENDLALKKAKLDDAQRRYERLKDGADAEQLVVLEARLDAAKAQVAAFSVLAPFDGLVAELNAKAGNSIKAGEIAVTVADFSSWLIETTDLTEIDVVTLSEGGPVTVTLDALPEATLNGVIESISQTYQEKQGDVVYAVTVALDESHPQLRWGMTAIVNFEE
ncbi:MAG TPA: HlyD family efflux transporter periplasmic adaptor subunit [Anaerolineales bacterium]|nr:HlyD family efflux transporter periplasmic adaptor subunit [Anaerolineales bacterium]